MATKEGQSFDLPTSKFSLVSELFTTQAERDDAKREKVFDIPLDEIDDFPEHPFQVRDDEAMQAMVESVKKSGVLTPAVARQKENGRYELISGHRRKRACELAGLDTLPVIVREMSRDEAVVFMVESNFQRETVLPSEKAWAYKMRLDAMKRQGRRTDLTSRPLGTKSRSDETLAEKADDSARQIQRFIRLTELVPPLLQLVDNGKIAFRPAVELSHLPAEQQTALLEEMTAADCTPSLAQAIKMKAFANNGQLNAAVIASILQEEKPNQREKVSIPLEKVSRFFGAEATPKQMEDTILEALELYRKHERQRKADAR